MNTVGIQDQILMTFGNLGGLVQGTITKIFSCVMEYAWFFLLFSLFILILIIIYKGRSPICV